MPEPPAGLRRRRQPRAEPLRRSGSTAASSRISEYEQQPGVITFLHTEVDPEFEGKGLGGALASNVLDDVRARGLQVVARCPFIAAYIRRHREYRDLLLRTKLGGSGDEPAA